MAGSQTEKKQTDQATVAVWQQNFINDQKARNIAESRRRKYEVPLRQLLTFTKNKGIRHVGGLTTGDLREFRNSWKDNALSKSRKQDRLRKIFKFAISEKWITDNPALGLEPIRVEHKQKLPYSDEEIKKRIGRIMTQQLGKRLTLSQKLLLSAVAVGMLFFTITFGFASALQGQGETVPASLFQVASITTNQSGPGGGWIDISKDGEQLTGNNMPLGAYMLVAYNVTVRQLSGPKEFLSERYDISAKAEHPVASAEMVHMLQGLLAERFNLVAHHENNRFWCMS